MPAKITPEAQRKSEIVLVPVTRATRRQIERAAHRARVSLAEFGRRAFARYLAEGCPRPDNAGK